MVTTCVYFPETNSCAVEFNVPTSPSGLKKRTSTVRPSTQPWSRSESISPRTPRSRLGLELYLITATRGIPALGERCLQSESSSASEASAMIDNPRPSRRTSVKATPDALISYPLSVQTWQDSRFQIPDFRRSQIPDFRGFRIPDFRVVRHNSAPASRR